MARRMFKRARNGMTYVPPVSDDVLPLIANGIFERHEEVWLAEEHGLTIQALRGLFNAAYLNSARGRFASKSWSRVSCSRPPSSAS